MTLMEATWHYYTSCTTIKDLGGLSFAHPITYCTAAHDVTCAACHFQWTAGGVSVLSECGAPSRSCQSQTHTIQANQTLFSCVSWWHSESVGNNWFHSGLCPQAHYTSRVKLSASLQSTLTVVYRGFYISYTFNYILSPY